MTIFLGAVVKNISASIPYLEQVLKKLYKEFPDLIVCIYEDNSSDDTKDLLRNLQTKYTNIFLQLENFDPLTIVENTTFDGKPCRIECIAYARNKLMDLLESKGMGLNSDDLCIMIDADIHSMFNVSQTIFWCKYYPEKCDGMFANGVGSKGQKDKYYDAFAYRDYKFPFDLELYSNENDKRRLFKYSKIQRKIRGGEKIKVYSAFGGLAIYRGTSILGKRYSAVPTEDLNSFYKKFIKENPEHYEVNLAKNLKSSKSKTLFNDEMKYYDCWGYKYPIVCEHIPFHISMIMNGNDNLYIESSLSYVSDH